MIKTVIEVDLAGYSTVCDNLEQALDVSSVAQLNEQIQSFIDVGLEAVHAARDQTVMATTGDGAIIVLDEATAAHDFAISVHQATRTHNLRRGQSLAQRVFRIGMATGEIAMQPRPQGGFDIAGTTIARAVRLEAKARPGGILIDEATFASLPATQAAQYGPGHRVAGKRGEEFVAHSCNVNLEIPPFALTGSQRGPQHDPVEIPEFGLDLRRRVLTLFRQLKSWQYTDLIFLLEIPIGQRPADTMNLDQQKAQVLRWAEESRQLDLLLMVLGELTAT